MHRSSTSEDEPMAEINLIPLIDISLTLVIILMVTTVFIHNPGFKLNLPKTVTHEGAPETPKDVTVSIAPTGAYYFNGKPVSLPQLQSLLITAADKDKGQRVLLKGDKSVRYEQVMDVMDAIRQAGLTHVLLPTEMKHAADAATMPPGG